MKSSVAIFVRHGDYHQLPDTPSAHQPFPLTEKGQQQAVQAVSKIQEMLKEQGWVLHPVMHSSCLLRAWQTASVIAEGLGRDLGIVETDRLCERGVGAAANMTVAQVRKALEQDPRCDALPDDWKSNSHYRLPLPGAESLMEAGQRVATYVSHILDGLDEPRAVVFVGHGASIRHAAHHLGVLAFDEIATLSMYHADPVALLYDTQGNWSHAAGHWKVRLQNEQAMD